MVLWHLYILAVHLKMIIMLCAFAISRKKDDILWQKPLVPLLRTTSLPTPKHIIILLNCAILAKKKKYTSRKYCDFSAFMPGLVWQLNVLLQIYIYKRKNGNAQSIVWSRQRDEIMKIQRQTNYIYKHCAI